MEQKGARQLNDLAALAADMLSEATGVKIPSSELRGYIGQNGKAILPTKKPLERMRRRRDPFYVTLCIFSKPLKPRTRTKPRPFRTGMSTRSKPSVSRTRVKPESISGPQLSKLATLVADMLSKASGVRIPSSELRLTPDKARAILPSRTELEGMRKRKDSFGFFVRVGSKRTEEDLGAWGESVEESIEEGYRNSMEEYAAWFNDAFGGYMQRSCSQCGSALGSTDNYCPTCGTPASSRTCSQCGETLSATDSYCRNCGSRV